MWNTKHDERNGKRHFGTTIAILTPVVLGLLALSGCQLHVGTGGNGASTSAAAEPTIPKRDVEQITAQLIRDKSGGGPYVITCPKDLPIALNATMQCVLTDQKGVQRELTVTIGKVDSPDNATWDWEVGPEISRY